MVAAIAVLAWLSHNFSANLVAKGITIDFGFLKEATSFPIGESLISYSSGDSYLRALTAGLLNTIRLAIAGIALATVFGVIVGLTARIGHPLLTRAAKIYVEFTRNVPLLLILVVCATVVRALPGPRQAWAPLDGVMLSSRGLYMPLPLFEDGIALLTAAILLIAVAWAIMRLSLRGKNETGAFPRSGKLALAGFGAVLIGLCAWGFSTMTLDRPALVGFNFRGGWSVTPEYLAMLFGLAFYTSGFIAEIVRGSLAALPKGQSEAASSLGLGPFLTLWLVLAPQALRLMLPPLANQYLNLIKNTTLAVLIGYPDLVSVGNTALNQTGRAIETVTIYLLIYLSLSLVTSVLIRRLEKRAQLVKL
ncbi:amino acid ABC transporter permease [Pseudaminobacter soli (ex Li et al. 2025)]|uniref:amino acid ABC transporter permease n=1 Tax=Pseudaminobacter soli (ex Li et al. 2025) TaxID=1295366 RepID=UPI002475ADBC|nr:ABC transporter permease subunit [Mesorhizobium soli]